MIENASDDLPYGPCECRLTTCMECHGFGPAAFEVTRDGKRIRVCTKCDLSTDTNKTLLVKMSDQGDPFQRWDALGFLCVLLMLREKENSGEVL